MVWMICRAILGELRKTSPQMKATSHPVWQCIKQAVRSGEDSSLTASAKNLQTYLYYLQSSRKHAELLSKYQGRGERSIEESAKLVGLSLPGVNLESEQIAQK